MLVLIPISVMIDIETVLGEDAFVARDHRRSAVGGRRASDVQFVSGSA